MDKDILILGSGSSINNYLEEIRYLANKLHIFTWGHSSLLLLNLNIKIDFVSFLDWHSIYEFLELIVQRQHNLLETTLFVFDPILTNDYHTQLKYIGTSQGLKSGEHNKQQFNPSDYRKCVGLLNLANKFLSIRYINSTSTKFLNNHDDIYLLDNIVVIQNQDYQGEDKLHCAILPLLLFLNVKTNIYLLGFEGMGPRFMHQLPRDLNLGRIKDVRKKFMPLWFKKNLPIFSLVDSPNNYFPFISIEDLCKKF